MMNVLILDDEKEIADLVEVYLKNENYNIYKFYDSDEAIKCIDTVKLDCAILDVMIKGKNGFEICQYIRNKKLNFPIIMLTAKIENQGVAPAGHGCGLRHSGRFRHQAAHLLRFCGQGGHVQQAYGPEPLHDYGQHAPGQRFPPPSLDADRQKL